MNKKMWLLVAVFVSFVWWYLSGINTMLRENQEELTDIKSMLYYQERLAIATSPLGEKESKEILGYTSRALSCNYMFRDLETIANISDGWKGSYFKGKGEEVALELSQIRIMLPALVGDQHPSLEDKKRYDDIVPRASWIDNFFKRELSYFAENYVFEYCQKEKVNGYTKKQMSLIIQRLKEKNE